MKITALVLAGGSGSRMGASVNKVLLPVCGKPCLVRSVEAFLGEADEIVVVCRPSDRDSVIKAFGNSPARSVIRLVEGGPTRQASVLQGLRFCRFDPEDIVLVHDGARCMVTSGIIRRVIASCLRYGSGVAAIPVSDTVRLRENEGFTTLDRANLIAVQTPQGFRGCELLSASLRAEADHFDGTDDAALMERSGYGVHYVEGEKRNIKMTVPEDIIMAEAFLGSGFPVLRVGHGYDVHRFADQRKLWLCGVEIPYEKGLLGHSDADVALHALMDAMLGAAALGDIGQHFPDTDPTYSGISSVLLLKETMRLLHDHGFSLINADITIVAQKPKLASYIPEMRRRIAEALGVDADQISVKATTTEKLGFEGRLEGISAQAVCLLSRITASEESD